MAELREALQEGLDSGVAEGDVFEQIRQEFGLTAGS